MTESDKNPMIPKNGGSVPSPDPTVMTQQATDRLGEEIRREIVAAQALTGEKFKGLEQRFDDMDKATRLVQDAADKHSSLRHEALKSLQELIQEKLGTQEQRFRTQDEKFTGVAKQFTERDTRTEQLSLASKVAVDAALSAQKEAAQAQNDSLMASITKSEAAFTKQFDQTGQLIAQQTKSSDDKIGDLKDRIGLIEGRSKGIGDSWGWLVGAVAVAVAVAMFGMEFLQRMVAK